MKKYLIAILGPTAIGKTALSVEIARYFDTEIISADSRQFFKEMNIGTAVPSGEELSAVPHHFIQHISVEEDYSVGDFERDAIQKIEMLFQQHQVLVMAGGSGLYVKAVTEGLDDFPEIDPEIRHKLIAHFKKDEIEWLQKKLEELDPEYYQHADIQNPHRLIRALEICIGTGKAFSSFLNKEKTKRTFQTIKIGLTADREIIYDRINLRVDLMIENGLVDEARRLYSKKDLNALNTVGYKELFKYFDGEWPLDKAVAEIKKNTRRFAKRQLTWFRKDEEINWFDYKTDPEEIIEFLEKSLSS